MSTLKVNSIEGATGGEVDINATLGTIPAIVVSGVTTVSSGTTSAPAITPSGDSNTGIFFPSADTIAFGEGGVEAARIDSSGRLGIGTINPAEQLELFAGSERLMIGANSPSTYSRIAARNVTNTGYRGFQIDGSDLLINSNTSGNITLAVGGGSVGINSTSPGRKLDVVDSGASGSVVRSRVTTNNGGYLAYEALNSSGTSVFSVTHNGRINLSENIVFASGQGLDFSATANSSGTMTSELLADYEEGTWTPTLAYATPGTSSFTYSFNSGWYCKVGTLVHVTWDIRLSAFTKGTASGTLLVAGFPFTSINSGDYARANQVVYLYQWPYATTAGYLPFVSMRQISSTFAGLVFSASNSANVQMSDPDSDSMMFGALTYRSS